MLDIEDAFSVTLAAQLLGISNVDWKIETKSGDGETFHEEWKIKVRPGGIANELWKTEYQSGVRRGSVNEKLRANRGLGGSNQRRVYLGGSGDKVKHFHCDICGKSYIAKGHLMANKIFNHSPWMVKLILSYFELILLCQIKYVLIPPCKGYCEVPSG